MTVFTSDSSSVKFATTSLHPSTRSSRWSCRHSSSWPASVFSLHHFPRSVRQRDWRSGSSFTSSALWWRILWTSTLQSLESWWRRITCSYKKDKGKCFLSIHSMPTGCKLPVHMIFSYVNFKTEEGKTTTAQTVSVWSALYINTFLITEILIISWGNYDFNKIKFTLNCGHQFQLYNYVVQKPKEAWEQSGIMSNKTT